MGRGPRHPDEVVAQIVPREPCRRTILADDPWKSLTRDVHDADAIRDILHALGLPTEPPTLARARDPTDDDA